MATRSPALDDARRSLWQRDAFSFIPDRDMEPLRGRAETGGQHRILFAGFPSDYSLAFLLALLDIAAVRVAGIVTSPGAHPAILGDNALSRIADHLEVPLLRAWRVNDEHTLIDVAALEVEAAVMASFDQIIGARMLAVPAHGWMNIHPSALPARRGPEPVYWTIADGDAVGGITLHRAVPKVDAGPILAQRVLPVGDADTSGTLTRSLAAAGVELLEGALRRMLDDDPGDPIDVSAATYAPPVGHRHLDSAPSAAAALRMVRAGVPNMPAWTDVDGHAAYVLAAHAGAPSGGRRGLSFSDGAITFDDVRDRCGCHHNLVSCPHREE